MMMATAYPTPSDPSRSRAVLIGVDHYRDNGLSSDPALALGVRELARRFRDPAAWGIAERHCTVLTGASNTDEMAILDAVDNAAREAEDTLVVYFGGHGVTFRGQYYLAHSDAKPGDCGRWLSWERLRSRLDDDRTGARTRIVILDACESADAIDQGTPQGDAALLASCSGTERAWIPPKGPYPAYTGALIDVLARGDAHHAAFFTPSTLHQAIKSRLTAANQEPDFLPRRDGGARPWLRNRRATVAYRAHDEEPRASEPATDAVPKEPGTAAVRAESGRDPGNGATARTLPPVEPAPSDQGLSGDNVVRWSIVGVCVLAMTIIIGVILDNGTRTDNDDEFGDSGAAGDDTSYHPDPPSTTLSTAESASTGSLEPQPLVQAEVGDCLDDDDSTADAFELSFADECDDYTFEVVEVIEGSTDVDACERSSHGYTAVTSESAGRVLCLKHVYGSGDAAYADVGECIRGDGGGWAEDWHVIECEIGAFEIIERFEGDSESEACEDLSEWATGTRVGSIHEGFDLFLCAEMIFPYGDLAYADVEECLTKSGSGSDANFVFADCSSANVVVTGRIGELNEYEMCNDDAWYSWQSPDYPEWVWTICYRYL